MKPKEYIIQLSLSVIGLFIALVIDNYREDRRDKTIINAYINIVKEDLKIDIEEFARISKFDSSGSHALNVLFHRLKKANPEDWDSLEYCAKALFRGNILHVRQVGFSLVTNSDINHLVAPETLKSLGTYYISESNKLEFGNDAFLAVTEPIRPFYMKHSNAFKEHIKNNAIDIIEFQNTVFANYYITTQKMEYEKQIIKDAKELLRTLENY